MPTISNDEFWRQRAAEMRAIADGLAILPLAKASILRFADEYDRLAERAARSMPELGWKDPHTCKIGQEGFHHTGGLPDGKRAGPYTIVGVVRQSSGTILYRIESAACTASDIEVSNIDQIRSEYGAIFHTADSGVLSLLNDAIDPRRMHLW
jgi:hypothetical protein